MLDDPGTNQLRLNSWGRLYVSEKLLTKEADLFRKQCVDSIKNTYVSIPKYIRSCLMLCWRKSMQTMRTR